MASPSNKTERVVGFDCEFVDPPPEVLQSECPLCLLVIREPHQLTCCGKKFCLSCIKHIEDNKKPCPTCKSEQISRFPDKGLKQTLYGFKVRCSHQKNGCEWTGELGQLDGHLNIDPQPEKQLDGCKFVEICCIYDCGDEMQRRYIQTHQNEHCTKRPFSCEHCHNYESNFDDVIHNHWPVCGSFPLCCPNECGLKVQRQNVDSHVADKCPLTTISCDFLHVGCAVKLPRKDMPEHLRENLLTHISLLATSHAKQQAQITSLEAENNELKTNVGELQEKVAFLEQENQSLKGHSEAKPLQAALNPVPSDNAVPRTTIPLGPPVLTMTNFQQHKREDNYWFSPPVYTHHQGYKICLEVDANGWGDGAGTHVSVYAYFMRGEFDDSLKWPFRGTISYQLLDQLKGTDHETNTVVYNNATGDRVCSRVTEGERAESGRGLPKFIAHTKLEPKYLQNDTLVFQVYEVELR